jgi:hypothetical protein
LTVTAGKANVGVGEIVSVGVILGVGVMVAVEVAGGVEVSVSVADGDGTSLRASVMPVLALAVGVACITGEAAQADTNKKIHAICNLKIFWYDINV